MALTAVLVEATPYLLKYLITAPTSTSVASVSSPSNMGNLTINNALGATPDLATDALAGSVAGGRGGKTLQNVVNAVRSGYQQIAAGAVLTRGQARQLLMSGASLSGGGGAVGDRNTMCCEMFITHRRSANTTLARQPLHAEANLNRRPGLFTVDASLDASTNPIVIVKLDRVPVIGAGQQQTAYLTIRCRHSYDW